MISVGVKAISYVFGGRKVCNADFAAQHGFDAEFVNKKLGIKYRYEVESGQVTSDLAVDAIQMLLTENSMDITSLDCLCVVTQTPDYKLPHTSAVVHQKMGLNSDVAAFDINLGCSGYVYGLSVFSAFMEANDFSTGVLVTADTYSKIINPNDRATSLLFSDVAAATLLTRGGAKYSIGKGTFNTDGTGYDRLIANNNADGDPLRGGGLFMDGRAIYNFMMTRVPEDVTKCLQKNAIDYDDVNKFIFHQANKFMIDSLRKSMKLDPSLVVNCVENFGNTVSSSIPIALALQLSKKTKTILISAFGVGLSWASNVLLYNEE